MTFRQVQLYLSLPVNSSITISIMYIIIVITITASEQSYTIIERKIGKWRLEDSRRSNNDGGGDLAVRREPEGPVVALIIQKDIDACMHRSNIPVYTIVTIHYDLFEYCIVASASTMIIFIVNYDGTRDTLLRSLGCSISSCYVLNTLRAYTCNTFA
jgi:hypothetical protein